MTSRAAWTADSSAVPAHLDVAPLTGPADEDDETLLAIAVQSEAGILGTGYVEQG